MSCSIYTSAACPTLQWSQAGHWSAQGNGRAIILGKALLLPLENTKSQNYGNGMYGFQQTRPFSLLWFPGCEVNSNLIFVGDAVLHSALAVEKLGNGQNRSINNGFGPRNNFVSKTYLFFLFTLNIFFSESERRQKKKMLVDYLYTNLKNHNFWAYKYFFCEFLGLLNISGNICPCKYQIYYIRLKGKCSWWTDFLTGLFSHLASKCYHLPRETKKIE